MPHIRKVYDDLVELRRELSALKDLILTEREAIVQLDMPGMENCRKGVEDAYARISPISRRLAADIDHACRISGIEGPRALTPMMAAVPKPDREQFMRLHEEIQALSSSVDNELSVNRAILNDSINFTSQSLTMFTSALKSTGTSVYGSAGRFVETIDQPRIICKEI